MSGESALSDVLIVKNLPKQFNTDDATDFLKFFGAHAVRYMGDRGRFKNTAFAFFKSSREAQQALRLLHQTDILGSILRVEYSTTTKAEAVSLNPVDDKLNEGTEICKFVESTNQPEPQLMSKINYLSQSWDIPYTIDESLRYHYPEPTDVILRNICNCLASVPKFYVQVLHLMNKMNLPPPFTNLTAAPPIKSTSSTFQDAISEESELESSDDSNEQMSAYNKRRLKMGKRLYTKRYKLQIQQEKLNLQIIQPASLAKQAQSLTDVFDIVHEDKPKLAAIPIQLSSNLVTTQPSTEICIENSQPFGKIERLDKMKSASSDAENKISESSPQEDLDQCEESGARNTPYITSRELFEGKLSEEEQQNHPVLKKYVRGEPCTRLYIKNISKLATETDLKYIFGRYVDWGFQSEVDVFNMRYMTEGRMKGQAFITLPNLTAAECAVNECHAFMLKDKPISVSFAKSDT